MTDYLFPPPFQPIVPVVGVTSVFPVHRIFCVGRNYAEHAAEMGVAVDREAPFYFTKPATAIVASGSTISYPPGTSNYHYEMELVVAIGAEAFDVPVERAGDAIFGFAAGLDMTRRDLQLKAREKQRPWDLGKAFEQSAVISALHRRESYGPISDQGIALAVNGVTKQSAKLSDLVFGVDELVADLSRFYHLGPGDLIYTGTPAGVGPVVPGDRLVGHIDGLEPIELLIDGEATA